MKSIAKKLQIIILSIIIINNTIFILCSRKMSTDSILNLNKESMLNLASSIGAEIRNTNEQQFNMLKTLGYLNEIRDPEIDLRAKYDMITEIAKNDSSFIGMAIYDKNGVGWTTTGKYQDLSDREYLLEALQNKPYVMKPNLSPVNGRYSTFYAMPYTDYARKLEGVLVSVIDGAHLSNIVSNIVVGKGSYPFVIDRKTGTYVASSNMDDIKNEKNIKDNTSKEFKSIIDDILIGNEGVATYFDEEKKQNYICTYAPIGGNCNWSIFCAAPVEDFLGGLHRMITLWFIIFLVSTVTAVILTGSLISHFIKPLKKVNTAINTIATGNADLTQKIEIAYNDEVGSVVKGFNTFTKKLHSIISDIKTSKDDLYTAGNDLELGTEDTANAISEIINEINNMTEQISHQIQNVSETSSAVNQIASNIESFEKMIENQSSGVTEASAAVEEMIGNINSVNQSVIKLAESFEALGKDAQEGSRKQLDVNERIEQIEQQSRMLQEANLAIANIASQTNLLAMNAAIEAAHAGEAGKGFSVVADEIRKLSETSTEQSKTIGDQLQKIKESIEGVVDASAQSNKAFMSVSSRIEETDELVRQIKGAMDEQQSGSKQINDALRSMNNTTTEVGTAASQMTDGNKTIIEEIKELQDSSTTMRKSVSDITARATRIEETGAALSQLSVQMKKSINKIGSQIDLFKV